MTQRSVIRAAVLLTAGVLAACEGAAPNPGGGAEASPISIAPPAAAVPAGSTVSFTANRGVTWTVDEGAAGGSITATGVYTAPSWAGTFHVTASTGSSSATATVTVNAPPTTCTSFTYSAWGSCSSSGAQTRTVTGSSPAGCTGGAPAVTRSCTPPPATCTSFTYSAWGSCSSSGAQTRTVTGSSPAGCTGGAPVVTQSCTPPSPGSSYDAVVLADRPVALWSMSSTSATEPDLTGHGHAGTYQGGQPSTVGMPNGDRAVDFNGSSEYLTIPSSPAFSVPTTGDLTWEAWIRPDTLQFPNESSDGYVDWMGKCASYSPTCEWEARMYSTRTAEGRPNRMSAYVFNPTAGLGSAADWQPVSALIVGGHWYHVVGEYTTHGQPSGCPSSASYPGSINIWVNGVPWSQSSHSPTGCMSQYGVKPVANGSPLNVGTMAMDTWFPGAVGKVAIYDYLLTQQQISNHYAAMTGTSPSGSCGATCTLTNP